MGLARRAAAVLVMAFAGFAASAEDGLAPPEPDGVWAGPMIGDTPTTLRGATVVDVAGLEALMPRKPLLIDSGPADRKPDRLPAGTLWRPSHRSIPGARWFPGSGRGDLDPARAAAFLEQVGKIAAGDKARPIVTFCQPRCWGSWNVGRRLVDAGYTNVHWFPGGTNAWQETHETLPAEPENGWGPDAAAGAGR